MRRPPPSKHTLTHTHTHTLTHTHTPEWKVTPVAGTGGEGELVSVLVHFCHIASLAAVAAEQRPPHGKQREQSQPLTAHWCAIRGEGDENTHTHIKAYLFHSAAAAIQTLSPHL